MNHNILLKTGCCAHKQQASNCCTTSTCNAEVKRTRKHNKTTKVIAVLPTFSFCKSICYSAANLKKYVATCVKVLIAYVNQNETII
mmetsp:Transcript_23264/g.51779  ORF Transcript_23264/g.51779 Transcript_23264/m.51779 type:complete len:86 (+) Transcript_23264:91-348(+)